MKIKTIYAEITNQCNLNCATCYNRSGINTECTEISRKQIEDIIKTFLPYGLERFLISGGEPTLHSEFNDILNLIAEYQQISFGIVTNGTNHDDKLIHLLNTNDRFKLQVSLDGSTETQNSKTRGSGHYNKAIEFVKKICNPNIKPLIKMVISQYNYDDIEAFYNLVLAVNCIPEFAFIYRSGNAMNDWDSKMLTAHQKIGALNLIDQLNVKNHTEAFLPFCMSKCPYINNVENLSICVKIDGMIQPCQGLYDSRYSLGNVYTFDINDFSKKLIDTMILAQKRYNTSYNCNKCILKKLCHKGCMASAVELNDDPLANDGDCEFRKLQFIRYNLKGVIAKNYE